ncbi:hypothetical protein F66182_8226 [Fusarium sp. NRRL 66182]|nr:hypothetical protein F66182_8226 [Fusarium sp. NRRL 66182]
MYVSSRSGGTRPFRQLKAREFHEIQWSTKMSHTGRLVGEKSIDLGELSQERNQDKPPESKERATHRRSLSLKLLKGHSKVTQMVQKIRSIDKNTLSNELHCAQTRQDNRSTVPIGDMLEQRPSFHVSDYEIPNANFARKFGLYTDSTPLPPFIRELPVAEDKAMDMAVNSPLRELIYSWTFQGPFTPQLWFDSGIDYRWKHSSC